MPASSYQQVVGGGSGGGTGTNVGPVINVTSSPYSASASATDNATAFASIATAATAAYTASPGAISIRNIYTMPSCSATCSSNTVAVTIAAGDTVIVWVGGPQTVGGTTISDGTNQYMPVTLQFNGGNAVASAAFFSTGVGGSKAFTGTLTISAPGANDISGFVLDMINVGSIGQSAVNSGSSTSPSQSTQITIQDNNNWILSGISFWSNASNATITANVGTLQGSFGSTSAPVVVGGGLVTNTAASANTSVTANGTLSNSQGWAMASLELRTIQATIPTVYFPAGNYNYSSGLNFPNPVTLKGEPGSQLCYTGSAHAIDFGPVGLTIQTLVIPDFTIQGLTITCGGNMTQGVYSNTWLENIHILNNTFINFGNGNACMLDAPGENDDYLVSNNKFFIVNGMTTAGVYCGNVTNTQLRFIGNNLACFSPNKAGYGTSGACGYNVGPGIASEGIASNISSNNFNYFCPNIVAYANDVRIDNNYMEAQPSAAAVCPDIAYNTTDGVHITNNYINANTNQFAIKANATQILANALIAFNFMTNNPAAQEVVSMNNLTGQTGNLAWQNMCAITSGAASAPCPKIHTIAGNISQWNGDYAGSCTMNGASGCPAITFLGTYNVAPKCTASWNGTGALTGFIKVATSTTQLTITSSVAADTAVMFYNCSQDAQ